MVVAPSNNESIENVGDEGPDLARLKSLRFDDKQRMIDHLRVSWTRIAIALVIIAGLCAGLLLVPSLPPRSIVMATGPDGSAFAEIGPRYREVLGRAGIEVKLLATGGEIENLARLRDPHSGVGVGFVLGGSTTPEESPELVSLGAIFYEPLWLFHRREIEFNGGKPCTVEKFQSDLKAVAPACCRLSCSDETAFPKPRSCRWHYRLKRLAARGDRHGVDAHVLGLCDCPAVTCRRHDRARKFPPRRCLCGFVSVFKQIDGTCRGRRPGNEPTGI